MPEDKKDNKIKSDKVLTGEKKSFVSGKKTAVGKSVYGEKKKAFKARRKGGRPDKSRDEFEQRIVDLARVTRVMAGGKRMRFRACVAIGNKKGKIGLGMDKGADVAIAVNKAVAKAKKNIIDVPMVNDTIPHKIYYKLGAAKILLKPARKGKGVIAGGAARIILELSGIKNITSKILGTNNAVNVAKSTIVALDNIKKVEGKRIAEKNIKNDKKIDNKEKNKVKK